jgi:tRNA pseudouridine55 synthase
MNGLLIIDKPEGFTSHDVVSRVRRALRTKRVGHTGTLDPFATGVLVLLVGKATRLARFLDKDEKEYEATIRFGFETDTGDRTGTARKDTQNGKPIFRAEVEAVLREFTGEIRQVPPMYSAKKIGGKKLYELARRGEEVDRRPELVNIYAIEIIGGHEEAAPLSEVRIRVSCSAGTYIRTLAEDIGRRLGTAAHLCELRRTRAGKFDISQSLKLAELEGMEKPWDALRALDEAVSHLPEVVLSDERVGRTRNGLSTSFELADGQSGDAVRMLSGTGELIAVGTYEKDEMVVQPKVVLV